MATAIIAGLAVLPDVNIAVLDRNEAKRRALSEAYHVTTLDVLPSAFDANTVVVLAVKPQQLRELCIELAPRLHGALVLSVAAGIRVSALARWLGGHQRIVRTMPNTPSQVGLGVTGMFAPAALDASDRERAARMMAAVGQVIWVDEEAGLDAISAISGSGPAYVFYLIEALALAAQRVGFDPATAQTLAFSTFDGAIALAKHSGLPVATLRANVTSKKGSTEQAIACFDKEQLSERLIAGVLAAQARSLEMGTTLSQDDNNAH